MIDEIIDNFSLLDEWDDRYRYLIELGKTLAPLSERERTGINKVQGCASQVWLSTKVRPNGSGGPVLEFVGDSDAHIVRGLIAVLLALFSVFLGMTLSVLMRIHLVWPNIHLPFIAGGVMTPRDGMNRYGAA